MEIERKRVSGNKARANICILHVYCNVIMGAESQYLFLTLQISALSIFHDKSFSIHIVNKRKFSSIEIA